MEAPHSDLCYLQPLLRIAYYCGLCPVYDIRGGDCRIRPWYKYYGITLICYFVLGNATVLPRVVFTMESDFPTSLIVIENISLLSLSAALATYTYKVPVRHADGFRRRLLELVHSNRFSTGATTKRIYAELIIGAIFLLLISVSDMSQYVIEEDVLLAYVGCVFWYSQEYYLYMVILVMRNYVLVLRGKLESMNRYIEDCTLKIPSKLNQGITWDFEELPRLFTALHEQVLFCNDMFGLPMLCLTVYCLGEVLYVFTTIFVSYVMTTEVTEYASATFFNIYLYFWMMHVLVFLFLILSACEATTKEMNRTCVLCYRLLHELQNGNSVLDCDGSLRHALTLLAIQSGACAFNFSAAGFFPFDNSSLFILLNIVLSYLLTVIQLS